MIIYSVLEKKAPGSHVTEDTCMCTHTNVHAAWSAWQRPGSSGAPASSGLLEQFQLVPSRKAVVCLAACLMCSHVSYFPHENFC